MFAYPKFDRYGKKVLCRVDGKTAEMGMNITVYRLKAGEGIRLLDPGMESALLLVQGDVTYYYGDESARAVREGFLRALPTCLHVPQGVEVGIEAHADSEVLVQSTPNPTLFPAKLYTPRDVEVVPSCEGLWENTFQRSVVTIFDYTSAPYSNMVLGEVYAPQGHWWSYIPHHHPQPEVYYYRFERPEGFGACFIGDKAYTVKDGSVGMFEADKTHVQVTAPAFPMYNVWMIRHLPGNPWDKTRIDDERYTWILQEGKA